MTGQRTGKCKGCGAHLRAADSIARGYSRRCFKLAQMDAMRSAIAPFSKAQQDKALDAIGHGKVVAHPSHSLFTVVSGDGSDRYITRLAGSCTCPAGQHDRPCYHLAAARAVAAILALAA